jgi:hypothetical protein
MELSLTTPEVDSKTTNHHKIIEIGVGNCEEPGGPYATVMVSSGEKSGETFTEHTTARIRVSEADVVTYLGANADNTLSILDNLKKALFQAMQNNGDLAAGTIS